MKIKVESTEIVITLTLTQVEADLLMGRAELAHAEFEGSSDAYLNVMGELAAAMKAALTKKATS